MLSDDLLIVGPKMTSWNRECSEFSTSIASKPNSNPATCDTDHERPKLRDRSQQVQVNLPSPTLPSVIIKFVMELEMIQ